MSERSVYEVQQGETHRVRIFSPVGSIYTATCTATLHRLPGGINSSTPDSATAETYAVSTYAGDGVDEGPGFDFELSAAETAALSPGTYLAAPKIAYTAPETVTDIPLAWCIVVKSYPS